MIEQFQKLNQLLLDIRNIENKRMLECSKKNEIFDASVINLCIVAEKLLYEIYKDDNVEVIGIFHQVEDGGEMYFSEKGNLKRVALLVDSCPHFLEKDFYLEKTLMTKIEAQSKGLLLEDTKNI